MRKLSKRKIIAGSGIFAAAVAIGVPAAVVYLTKDNESVEAIGKNVEREIENRFLDTLKLMPSNQFGHFQKTRIQDHETKLTELRKKVEVLTSEFNLKVKTRMPIYGIINDVLTVSDRFSDDNATVDDNWKEFSNRATDAIKAINESDWDALEEALFDISGDGEHKLLSQTYGIKKSDIDETNPVIKGLKDPEEYSDDEKLSYKKLNFGINNSFTSVKEAIDSFRDSSIDEDAKNTSLNTIVAALNMMTGTPFTLAGSTKDWHGVYTTPDFITTKPVNSVVFMILTITNKQTTGKLADLGTDWEEKVFPAWIERYRSIDQFFNVAHEPISTTGDVKDEGDISAFDIYDKIYFNRVSTMGSLNDSIESFLSGDEIKANDLNSIPAGTSTSVLSQGFIKGISKRYLTNWEFLRVFFGDTFDEGLGLKATTPSTPASGPNVVQEDNGWDVLMGVAGNPSIGSKGIQEYWKESVNTIFDIDGKNKNSDIPKIVLREDKGTGVVSKITETTSLWDKLTKGYDFQNMYNDLIDAKTQYESEVENINNDPYRIGIDVNKFKKMIADLKLAPGWSIRINSLLGNKIDQDCIDELEKEILYQKDGKTIKANDKYYDLLDGYVYSKDWEWVLRSTDSISIQGIDFNSDSKLRQFKSGMNTVRIFKPIQEIEESDDKTEITISWDAIEDLRKGGSHD